MKQDEIENVRVLRFFGSDDAGRAQVIREVTSDGKVNCQEMRKGSEVLLALQCEPDRNSKKLLDRCQERIQAACSPSMYATNDITLAKAAVEVMKAKDKLFVAADAETGVMLAKRLDKIDGAHSVFDFGRQSYEHSRFSEKIEHSAGSEKNPVFAAAVRVQTAFQLSGADFAIACVATADADSSTIVLGNKKGFWVRDVTADQVPALWMLDMLRRAALDKAQASGTSWKTYDAMRDALDEKNGVKEQKVFSYLPAKESEPASDAVVQDPKSILTGTKPVTPPPAEKAAQKNETATAEEKPKEEKAEKAEKPKKKNSAVATLLITLLVLIVIALIVFGVVWYISGGNPASFWNSRFLSFSGVNGASLV